MPAQQNDPNAGAVQTLDEGISLSPSALFHGYHINATNIGAGHFYLTSDIFGDGRNVIWQGQSFTPYGVDASGFEFKSQGELPRPHITLSNLFGAFTALNIYYGDLVGAKVIRKRVFMRNIDKANFLVSTNPNVYNVPPGFQPNTAAGWPDDVYYIHQKVHQNRSAVEYELASILEIENVLLPGRQVFANLCASLYRSTECSYTGIPVADVSGNAAPGILKVNNNPVNVDSFNINDVPEWNEGVVYNRGDVVKTLFERGRPLIVVALTDGLQGEFTQPPNKDLWFADDCSRCISTGCQKRFGLNPLPFAGFPGTGTQPVSGAAS